MANPETGYQGGNFGVPENRGNAINFLLMNRFANRGGGGGSLGNPGMSGRDYKNMAKMARYQMELQDRMEQNRTAREVERAANMRNNMLMQDAAFLRGGQGGDGSLSGMDVHSVQDIGGGYNLPAEYSGKSADQALSFRNPQQFVQDGPGPEPTPEPAPEPELGPEPGPEIPPGIGGGGPNRPLPPVQPGGPRDPNRVGPEGPVPNTPADTPADTEGDVEVTDAPRQGPVDILDKTKVRKATATTAKNGESSVKLGRRSLSPSEKRQLRSEENDIYGYMNAREDELKNWLGDRPGDNDPEGQASWDSEADDMRKTMAEQGAISAFGVIPEDFSNLSGAQRSKLQNEGYLPGASGLNRRKFASPAGGGDQPPAAGVQPGAPQGGEAGGETGGGETGGASIGDVIAGGLKGGLKGGITGAATGLITGNPITGAAAGAVKGAIEGGLNARENSAAEAPAVGQVGSSGEIGVGGKGARTQAQGMSNPQARGAQFSEATQQA